MNRLVPALGRRVVCIALLWQLATLHVTAQTQMFAGDTSQATSPATTLASAPSFANGQKLLSEVQSAITRKDYHAAVQSFRHAAAMTPKVPQLAAYVARMRDHLEKIGIDSALLTMPPQPQRPTMQRLPEVTDAIPINAAVSSDPATRKQEALRLVAIGQAALDRGDVTTALNYARQAESLKIPEKSFCRRRATCLAACP